MSDVNIKSVDDIEAMLVPECNHNITIGESPKPRVLILGHGGHGKDTAAAILSSKENLSFVSSSIAALNAIYPVLSYVTKCYDTNRVFMERHRNRELWRRLIKLYNTPDLTALARKIYSTGDIYVGMRDAKEFEAGLQADMFDIILWIDASNRLPLEDSMHIEFDFSIMTRVDNNGAEEDLAANVMNSYYIELDRYLKRRG